MGKKTRVAEMVLADLPPPKENRGRPLKYRWDTLGVGQSFVLKQVNGTPTSHAIRSAACRYGKRHGVKFVVMEMSGSRVQIYRRS